ncbi:Zinc finger SWIM domain-containing protein 6 [Schistosoma japonicum]|nr:Zinc finger SWIM domain-containing protein 6 [Schistosoma japonicum]
MKHKLSTCDFPSPFKLRRLDGGCSRVHHKGSSINSLLDLSAKVVAEHLPFEYVERMLVHIPEPVQDKIIYYSFPQRDSDIYTYASFHSKTDKTRDKIPYYQGLEYFQNNCVEDVIQIGFHLTGSVRQQPATCISETEGNKFKVSITFDRCKIISVCCDCGNKGLSWCPHVVALALFRIRQPHLVDYRSPISDALVRMNRSQLQKFAQYLIASHPNKILPSAQQLADQLLQPESNINKTSGAPDPTAGGSLQDVAAWYLDEAGVREQLRVELTNLASNGLYGFNHHNMNNLRLSSSGRCNSPNSLSNFNSTGQQLQQNNNTSRSSSSFLQRSNSSHRSHANSSSSLGVDSGMGNQNDVDFNCSTEVGLEWLLRYRRLTLSQNLLVGGPGSGVNSYTNPYTLNGLDFAFGNFIPMSMDPNIHSQPSTVSNNANNNNSHSNNRLYCSTTASSPSPFHWSNSIDTIDPSLHHCDTQSNGTQIAAMFAKVRELLAKRDSNGPRLLSLITEELLSCSKLPLVKSRRNQRNTTIDVSNRIQTIATPRISHGQQQLSSSDRQYSHETLTSSSNSVNNGYNHNSLSSSFNQSPPWTVRLWEEVCLLWTCVVLSPDCSVEAKKQWRYRFLTWARASRCPRDESYSIPSHFFTSIHESSDMDDDGGNVGQNQPVQSQQQSSCPQMNRPYKRASVFRLPIEVSYMSWDDVWWNHLLSIHDMKLDKHDEHGEEVNGQNRQHSTNVSLDDTSNDCSKVFRRPSSITPRRSIGFNRSFQLNSTPKECQCPYCDHSTPLNEPFPLLCLRVAALRSNGYLSQALQLAVFISQRLLRSVKMKTSLAAASVMNSAATTRSPPQTFSNIPWNSNNCHPNDIVARRMLFNTLPNGQALRANGMSPHNLMHNSTSRYLSSFNMPPSPSLISNHGKFSPSSRLTSPRPASLSPPVNVNHSRSVSTRRHGLSPNSNPSPGPSCTNHQCMIINNNNSNNNNNCSSNNNSINNNCWSNQSSYVYKSPSSCQQYVNHSPHCSPIPPASSISPIPFHNLYQPTATSHHPYHSKHIPHPNSPYSYPCPPPPPPHGVGSSIGCPNGGIMMQHPSHHNRSLTSPTPVNRSIGTRPLPSSYSTNGSVFSGDYFPVTEMDINCGLISTNCPSHAEIGWIGLPGRPILCLVECLLDAAAIVVEAANHQAPIALPAWGHMEKASFYLCLAVKVSLLSLFQQRRLVGSVSRLLACQHQETRLLTLLSTIPKDVTTALTMCEILCQLLGPPISTSSRLLNKSDHSTHSNLWWWSSLGIVVHSDTYPVHAVAEFVLNYLLDTQKLNQLISFNTCWSHPPSSNNCNVGGSNTNTANNISSIRIDDMVFTLVTRAMRFSILENYFMDNSSIMGTHLTRSNSSPQLLLSNNNSSTNQSCLHSQRMNYNHRGWGDYFNHPCSITNGNVETALAVNTEVSSSDQEFGLPSSTTTGSIESPQFTGGIMYDSHQRYLHPSNYCTGNNSCRWDSSQQHQQSLLDYDHRCMLSVPPNISVPPLPSIFSMSTQNCLKFNHNATTSGGHLNLLCNNNNPPTYHPMFNLQNVDSSRFTSAVTGTTSPTVGLPSTTTAPPTPTANNNILQLNQNPQYRRCLETLKLRQTRLAVALIRVSKSHIHRLDQIVQICDQNIHSPISLLAISQQVFAEAVGWKLRSPVNRKPSNSNLLDSVYSECGCLLNPNPPPSLILPTMTNPAIESLYTRDRIYLISTAFHLALIVVLRTLSRSVHWRRREMLAWAVSTALHVGPPACLYLIYHWSSYVNPREAVSWLAPALLTAIGTFDANTPPTAIPRMSKSLSSSKICSADQPNSSTIDNPMCYDHSSLFFGHSSWDDDTSMMNMNGTSDVNYPVWPSSWYSFCPTLFTSRSHSHSIIMAARLLSTSVPYSKAAREQIANAVRHMALQAAAKDPINCALPALNLSVKDPTAFDAVYRLILNSAESGSLGPIQLFSLARYMDNCGWTWRAFPFALHATRLFVLSTTQESHPIGNDVLWACLLGHRLGPGALQEILNHVIRNIHCPTLLTDILHRCRSIPCGMNFNPTNVNCNNNNINNNNSNNINTNTTDPSSIMNNNNNNMTNPIPVGRGNSCTTHYCNPTSNYINNNNNTGISIGTTGKMLSLDRPPLKGLLDAAINGYVMATHMRLANISPRQYAEFVDFLTRARDTFHLLRPDGPLQFRSLVECLRQTYRGKRKLVSLLAERFG